MKTDLIIVGAGPAGLAAAAAATAAGLDVVIVDERTGPGGSVDGELGASAADPDAAWLLPPFKVNPAANTRLEHLRAAAANATLLSDTFAWGLFRGWTLAVTRDSSTQRLDADQLVIATGSYVARSPFKGHDLTGVLTPLGLVNALAKGMISSEAHVAVLGDGWLADAVIDKLSSRRLGLTLLANRPRRAEVPVYVLRSPPVARGSARLQVVDLRCTNGQTVSLDVDWLILMDLKSVSSELAQLAGCEHRFGGYETGFIPVCGAGGATTVPGIYVAGALAGARNLDTAEKSGSVAGLSAAVHADRASPKQLFDVIAANKTNATTRPERVPMTYQAIEPGSTATACHCIGTSFAEVTSAIQNGARSIDDVKRQAKAGMGYCQGRDCYRSVVRLLSLVGDVDVATVNPMRVRPPVRPLAARALFESEAIK